MKLTKIQRYTAYCILLDEAKNPTRFIDYTGYTRKSNDCGFCFMASRIFAKDILDERTHLYYHESKEIFKEYFKRFRILTLSKHPTWEDRIQILKQCIEETHP